MKRLIAASLAPALALALASGSALHAQPAADADAITPGYWEYKTRALGFIPAGTDHKCLTGPEIDKFFDSLCNRHHTCTYPVREVSGGNVRLEGFWQNKEGKRTPVKANGSYSAKKVSLKATAKVSGVNIGATLDGRWLSAACPTGAR